MRCCWKHGGEDLFRVVRSDSKGKINPVFWQAKVGGGYGSREGSSMVSVAQSTWLGTAQLFQTFSKIIFDNTSSPASDAEITSSLQ